MAVKKLIDIQRAGQKGGTERLTVGQQGGTEESGQKGGTERLGQMIRDRTSRIQKKPSVIPKHGRHCPSFWSTEDLIFTAHISVKFIIRYSIFDSQFQIKM